MAFLDKIGSLAKNVSYKAGEMIELTKLSSRVNEHNGKISSLLTQIGQHYLVKFEAGEPVDAEVLPLFEDIRTQKEAIEALNAEIQAMKDATAAAQAAAAEQSSVQQPQPPHGASVFCGECGAQAAPGKKFCSECGGALPVQENLFCKGCGGELPEGTKFCPSCGTQV